MTSEAAVSSPQTNAGPTVESARSSTYGQILKSSAMVGGSQLLNILISMIRTKAMALMLGPGGFGLFGLYSSISNLTQTLAGMGINSSGVRQIAAAVSTGEETRIAATVSVLRRVGVLFGLLGAGLMVLFARPISVLTFANEQHSASVRWLSVAVFLTLLSGSQSALIQGMRRIADLAKMQILGALFGTLFGIPLVYVYREQGVVPSLICVAGATLITSWWYSRKVHTPRQAKQRIETQSADLLHEVSALLKLGIAFMVSSLVTLGASYAIRIIILHRFSLEATGLYQSAWTLGGLYVGFILQAMGADFYPRLTASAHDDVVSNRLVNEQALVGLLLAGPGILASLTFAPLVISLFYSAKFAAAVAILRWVCLGALLQVVSFPMGYVIVAKAKRGLFIACEVAWGVVSVGLAWISVWRFGLVGAGIASFGSYLFHWFMLYAILSRLSGFRWEQKIRRIGAVTVSLVAVVFFGVKFLPLAYSVPIGAIAMLVCASQSVRTLLSFFTADQIPRPVRKLLMTFGLLARQRDEALVGVS